MRELEESGAKGEIERGVTGRILGFGGLKRE